jgi:pimeloyl-ACP methyl ester carboxylesterase
MNTQAKALDFLVDGTTCRALYYPPTPLDGDKTAQSPCIVMAHGFGATREARLPAYAERFARAGLAVLVFDYRHFGASDGMPRQLLSISSQLRDWREAVGFARTLEGVDPQRIALFGSSLSGGHVVEVAARDARIAAVISQCPMMDGMAAVASVVRYAGMGQLLKLAARGLQDALSGLVGAAPVMLPIVGPPGTLAALSSEDAESGYRALLPEHTTWRNEVCARIMLSLGLYRPGRKTNHLPCPILIQICEKDTVVPATAAHAAARRAGSKATVRSYPIGHFDIYLGEAFERAITDQLDFLGKTLPIHLS